jgi:A/G-specific adenine glycosylase
MSPFSTALLWYKKHGRDLPWRKTRDPYRILVSEIMLQQTQVDRGILYYEDWLKRFPNWRTLARASKREVIEAWSGLGYNRRALFLKTSAEHVVKHGVPETEEGWRVLKGVGAYTAAAVSVFSQNKRAIPIDTNIRRVLGRALLGKTFPTPKDDARIRKNAMRYALRVKRFEDVPQALFDIAALYCKKVPLCRTCPLQNSCLAAPKFLAGNVRVPKQTVKKGMETIREGKKYPDRIYRGRILRLIKDRGSISLKDVGRLIDHSHAKEDAPWLEAMLDRMAKDGLTEKKRGRLTLAGD